MSYLRVKDSNNDIINVERVLDSNIVTTDTVQDIVSTKSFRASPFSDVVTIPTDATTYTIDPANGSVFYYRPDRNTLSTPISINFKQTDTVGTYNKKCTFITLILDKCGDKTINFDENLYWPMDVEYTISDQKDILTFLGMYDYDSDESTGYYDWYTSISGQAYIQPSLLN